MNVLKRIHFNGESSFRRNPPCLRGFSLPAFVGAHGGFNYAFGTVTEIQGQSRKISDPGQNFNIPKKSRRFGGRKKTKLKDPWKSQRLCGICVYSLTDYFLLGCPWYLLTYSVVTNFHGHPNI